MLAVLHHLGGLIRDGQGHRDHHHRGGGVGHPHGQEGHSDHEAQNDAPRAGADQQHDRQCDALVQIPFLHGDGQSEAAQEEEDDVITVGGGHVVAGDRVGQRQQDQRQQ